jgi:WD40 repeat protein
MARLTKACALAVALLIAAAVQGPVVMAAGKTPYLSLTGGDFTSVVFSPDGKRLAAASGDIVKVWDAETGRGMLVLEGHGGVCTNVVFSPDGKRIAAGYDDGTIAVWDAGTVREPGIIMGHSDTVLRVAFSPDGKLIASASEDKTVRVWDAETGMESFALKGKGDVLSVACSPDGKRLATAGNTVQVWDVADMVVKAEVLAARAEAAASAFINAIRDSGLDSGNKAAHRALAAMGWHEAAVPILIAGLKDPTVGVRVGCAVGLGRIGPIAKAAVPILKQARKDQSRTVQSAADFALIRIQPKPRITRQQPVSDSRSGLVFWYDEGTKMLFGELPTEYPPIVAPSGAEGVRAYVYTDSTCDDASGRYIGYFEKYPDPKAVAQAVDMISRALLHDQRLLRRPDSAEWVVANSVEGLAILDDFAPLSENACFQYIK